MFSYDLLKGLLLIIMDMTISRNFRLVDNFQDFDSVYPDSSPREEVKRKMMLSRRQRNAARRARIRR
jgi:hypothetical protein